jgi:hypothetical protein
MYRFHKMVITALWATIVNNNRGKSIHYVYPFYPYHTENVPPLEGVLSYGKNLFKETVLERFNIIVFLNIFDNSVHS